MSDLDKELVIVITDKKLTAQQKYEKITQLLAINDSYKEEGISATEAQINLFHEKDNQLLPYFSPSMYQKSEIKADIPALFLLTNTYLLKEDQLNILILLAEYGFPLDIALFASLTLEEKSDNSKSLIDYLLIQGAKTSKNISVSSILRGSSVAQLNKLTSEMIAKDTPIFPLFKCNASLKATIIEMRDMIFDSSHVKKFIGAKKKTPAIESKEEKNSLTQIKTNSKKYRDALASFADAYSNHPAHTIDYLSARLNWIKKCDENRMGKKSFKNDFETGFKKLFPISTSTFDLYGIMYDDSKLSQVPLCEPEWVKPIATIADLNRQHDDFLRYLPSGTTDQVLAESKLNTDKDKLLIDFASDTIQSLAKNYFTILANLTKRIIWMETACTNEPSCEQGEYIAKTLLSAWEGYDQHIELLAYFVIAYANNIEFIKKCLDEQFTNILAKLEKDEKNKFLTTFLHHLISKKPAEKQKWKNLEEAFIPLAVKIADKDDKEAQTKQLKHLFASADQLKENMKKRDEKPADPDSLDDDESLLAKLNLFARPAEAPKIGPSAAGLGLMPG